jgi:hypothetical protein
MAAAAAPPVEDVEIIYGIPPPHNLDDKELGRRFSFIAATARVNWDTLEIENLHTVPNIAAKIEEDKKRREAEAMKLLLDPTFTPSPPRESIYEIRLIEKRCDECKGCASPSISICPGRPRIFLMQSKGLNCGQMFYYSWLDEILSQLPGDLFEDKTKKYVIGNVPRTRKFQDIRFGKTLVWQVSTDADCLV